MTRCFSYNYSPKHSSLPLQKSRKMFTAWTFQAIRIMKLENCKKRKRGKMIDSELINHICLGRSSALISMAWLVLQLWVSIDGHHSFTVWARESFREKRRKFGTYNEREQIEMPFWPITDFSFAPWRLLLTNKTNVVKIFHQKSEFVNFLQHMVYLKISAIQSM